MNDKLIKQFTPKEMAEYNHRRYERDKEMRLKYQKEYYQKHKLEIQKKACNRYRRKCGLKEEV